MRIRHLAAWVSGPALALGFLWLSFRGVDLEGLLAQIRQANPALLALNVAAGPVLLLLRAWRWGTLLRPIRADVPIRETFSATSIGYLAGLLPGRVGELVRPAVLSRRVHLPFAPTLATAGVERAILDLLTVLLLGALALVLPSSLSGIDAAHASDAPDMPDWLPRFRNVATLILALAILALAGVHFMGRHRVVLGAFLERRAGASRIRVVSAVTRWIASLLPGFAALATLRGLLVVVGQSLLIWAVTSAGMHAGIVACGVDAPPATMLVLMPILVAGLSIPTPGNTGTFHLAMKVGLVSFFGVDDATALGTGLVVHFCNWVPFVFFGSLSIALGGLRAPGAPLIVEPNLSESSGPS